MKREYQIKIWVCVYFKDYLQIGWAIGVVSKGT